MAQDGDLSFIVLTVVISFTILLLSVAVFSPLADQSTTGESTTERVTYDATLLPGDNTFTEFDDGSGTNEIVYETTGYGVNLSGASDSYVQSKSGFEVASDQNWTVSAWGYVEQSSASENMSLVSANGRVILTYNGSHSQWSAWYYDEGSRDSYRVNVSTSGNEAGNYTNIMAWANGTHLSIYRNNTQGEIKSITTESITSAPVDTTNWDGRIEEVRTFDDPLTSAERSTLVQSPAEEFPAPNVTSRAMFDQPDEVTQLLLYTDTKLQQNNVTFSQGFQEQIMQRDGMLSTNDYAWKDDGPQVQASSGGDLDGAPVAYASYDFNALGGISVDLTNWIPLAALAPLVLILSYLVLTFYGFRGSR